jgi:hypothetical protein
MWRAIGLSQWQQFSTPFYNSISIEQDNFNVYFDVCLSHLKTYV